MLEIMGTIIKESGGQFRTWKQNVVMKKFGVMRRRRDQRHKRRLADEAKVQEKDHGPPRNGQNGRREAVVKAPNGKMPRAGIGEVDHTDLSGSHSFKHQTTAEDVARGDGIHHGTKNRDCLFDRSGGVQSLSYLSCPFDSVSMPYRKAASAFCAKGSEHGQ